MRTLFIGRYLALALGGSLLCCSFVASDEDLFVDLETTRAKPAVKTTEVVTPVAKVPAPPAPKETIKTAHIPPDSDDDLFVDLETVPTKSTIQQKAMPTETSTGEVNLSDFGIDKGLLDKVPEPLRTVFQHITISKIRFKSPPTGNKDDLLVTGLVTIYGQTVAVEVASIKLEGGKTGISVAIGLPASWKLSDSISGELVKKFDAFSLVDPTLVLTNFDHIDYHFGVPVKIGGNMLGSVAFSQVQMPDIFKKVADYLTPKTVVFHAAFKTPINESTFHIHIPPSAFSQSEFPLSEFLPIPGLPQSVVNQLSNIKLQAPLLSYELGVGTNQITIQGTTEIFGVKNIASIATLGTMTEQAEKLAVTTSGVVTPRTESGATLRMYMPANWELANISRDLGGKINVKFSKAGLVFSSLTYTDKVLDVKIEPGLNFIADVAFADLPKNTVTDKLVSVLRALDLKSFHMHGIIKPTIADSTFELALPKGKPVPVSDFIHFDLLPNEMLEVFRNISISRPGIDLVIKAGENKFIMDGGAIAYGKSADVKLVYESAGFSLYLYLPQEWKASEASSSLNKLNDVVKRPTLILSDHYYEDKDFKVAINSGLTIIGGVNFAGPLKDLQSFINGVSGGKVKVEGLSNVTLLGSLQKDITKSAFEINIPVQVDLDISSLPLGIKQLTIGTITTGFGLDGISPATKFSASVLMYLKDKPEKPIKFVGAISTSLTKSSVSASMQGTLDSAFGLSWLALGNIGLEIDTDYGIMATTLWPFSGLSVSGDMSLGDDADKVIMHILGNIEVKTTDIPGFAFDGSVKNLKLSHFMWLFGKMVQQNIPQANIPTMEFNNVELKVVPKDTVILGQNLKQGVAADLEINFFGKSGGLNLAVSTSGIHGLGYLDNIDTPVIKITGPGVTGKDGKVKGGPVVGLDIGLDKQKIFIDGKLELPAIKVSSETHGLISLAGVSFKTTTTLFGEFDADLEVQLPTNDIMAGFLRGSMKQSALSSFEKLLNKAADDLVELTKKEVEKARDDVNSKLSGTKKDIGSGAQDAAAVIQREIDAIEKQIEEKKLELAS